MLSAMAKKAAPKLAKTKVKRRFPGFKELAGLMRFRKPILSPKRRRLARALTIWDLRKIAKRRTPQAPFDYTDGSAESESALVRARETFENIQFHPKVLIDVSKVDLSVEMLGQRHSMPLGIAPTGFARMMQHEGERAGAAAAQAAGVPFCLSTLGTTSIEEVVKAAPDGRNAFQLYMWKDRERSMELVHRAAKVGVDTLVLTVDVPVAGARLRDTRNGMTIPPSISTKTILNAIPRPAWWLNFLTTEPLKFASLDSWKGTVAELMDFVFDPTISYEDLRWIRTQWSGNLVVKGVQRVDDAIAAVDAGADAIILSNHGGRQMDRSVVPYTLIPDVVAAVGKRAEVHMDTGIMHGSDVIAAIASGANFTWAGRAYLYGLMAGGRAGVDRALEILRMQMLRTMKLLGARDLSELNPDHVSYLRKM